nr:AMP-binding protein [Streptomyces sp. NBC_00974]
MTQGSESAHSSRRTVDTVLSRFERWARDTPGAQAVVAGPESLTYRQLDVRANQLARHLLDAGLPGRAVVAVGAVRWAETVVALLGVLKAGAASAVVDVENPRTGQRQLAAAGPFALLTHAAHQARLDDGGGLRVIRLDAEAAAMAGHPTEPPVRVLQEGPGVCLFTGGPDHRAVPIGHDLLLAAHEGWVEVAGPTPGDRHLITAAPDLTAFAAGWPRALCTGGALVLPEGPSWTDGAIRRAVEAERVTVLHTDPGTAARVLRRDRAALAARTPRRPDEALHSLRMVTITGDRLYLDEQAALLARLRPGARLLNVYGTTESAGIGTWFELPQLSGPLDEPERLSLIGTPFPGCLVELRGGEICLTPPGGGEAIPTGDRAVLRPDGLLEFGGRIRDRITVDGSPLDPYPVESAIRTHEGVGAAVLARVRGSGTGKNAQPVLLAYLAPPAEETGWPPGSDLPDSGELRQHLAGRVPADSMPRAVVRLPAIPRDRAGREQRTVLPLPAQRAEDARTAGGAGGSGVGVGGGGGGGGGKYAAASGSGTSSLVFFGLVALVALGAFFLVLTKILWPGSTDLTGVPNPYATLFFLLYAAEAWAFAAGALFLFAGRSRMRRHGRRGPRITAAAHLAIVYLLAAWWPQDNFYRLAAKRDWPLQAALVYAFNVPLMIAAGTVALYVSRPPAGAFDFAFDTDSGADSTD